MHPIEITWYKILVLLTAAMGIGFGIYNIYLFNKIRTKSNCATVTNTESTTALWLNIVLVIFSSIIFLWSLFRLIFSGEMSKEVVNKTYNTHYHKSPDVSSYTSPLPYDTNTYVSPSATQTYAQPVSQLANQIVPASPIVIPSSPSTPISSSITIGQQYW